LGRTGLSTAIAIQPKKTIQTGSGNRTSSTKAHTAATR